MTRDVRLLAAGQALGCAAVIVTTGVSPLLVCGTRTLTRL